MKQNTMKKILCIISGLLALISLINCLVILFNPQSAANILFISLFEALSFTTFFLISLNTK